MKVAIRKTPDEDPKHYLLGERKNSFKTVYFKVKNRKLTASYNGVPVSVTLDTTYDGSEMYFKAGAYNNNADGSSHVEYANLELRSNDSCPQNDAFHRRLFKCLHIQFLSHHNPR